MAQRKKERSVTSKKPASTARKPAVRAPKGKASPSKRKRGGARVKYEDQSDEPDFGGEIDQILTR